MSAPLAYPTRFSWPMRILLAFLLIDIIGRSLLSMAPWDDWTKELDMHVYPAPLPSAADWHQAPTPDDPHPYLTNWGKALHSLGVFIVPVPEPATWKKIRSWTDVGEWTICWFNSRFELFENVVGFNQEWPMFSPNVSKHKTLTRARLLFDDGSTQIVRGLSDPEDLTRYQHWFQERLLQIELRATKDHENNMFGYCNYLASQHTENYKGSPLAKIYLFQVHYDYLPPGQDAQQFLAGQSGPPPEQVYPDIYSFDVKLYCGFPIFP